MFKKLSLAGAALAMSTVAMIPAEASAQRYGDRYERQHRGYDNYRGYDNRRNYRGNDRRYRNQRCNNGTTGTIVGAIAGGLLGRTIDSRGDRALGTVLGGVGGAVAGNAIEKSNNPRYCR